MSDLLKESGDDYGADWIAKDLHYCDSDQSVDRHLIGSEILGEINDRNAGNIEYLDIWKNHLIYILRNLSASLAKGEISVAPDYTDFYVKGTNVINGWRCKECGHACIDETHLESYISKIYLPIKIVELVKNNKLFEIRELKKIFYSKEVDNKRNHMVGLINDSAINLTIGNEWLWRCPTCKSKEMSAYKWILNENKNKLIDSKDNLKIVRPKLRKRIKTMSKLLSFW